MNTLSRVMVELVLVNEGTSNDIRTTSGPGSPISSDWKLFSSAIEDGAVEMRCASYDIGDLGEGNEDEWFVEKGLTGAIEGAGRFTEFISTGANDLLTRVRGDGAGESEASEMPEKFVSLRSRYGPKSSSPTRPPWKEPVDVSVRTLVPGGCMSKLEPLPLRFTELTGEVSNEAGTPISRS